MTKLKGHLLQQKKGYQLDGCLWRATRHFEMCNTKHYISSRKRRERRESSDNEKNDRSNGKSAALLLSFFPWDARFYTKNTTNPIGIERKGERKKQWQLATKDLERESVWYSAEKIPGICVGTMKCF